MSFSPIFFRVGVSWAQSTSSLNHIINQNVNKKIKYWWNEVSENVPKCLMKWWMEPFSSWICLLLIYRILPGFNSLPHPHDPSLQILLVQIPSTSCPFISQLESIHLPLSALFSHVLLSTDPENHITTPMVLGYIPSVNVNWTLNTEKKVFLLTLESSLFTPINFQPLLDHQGTLLFNEGHFTLSLKAH